MESEKKADMPKEQDTKEKTNTVSMKPIKETKTITVSQNSILITLIVIILLILAFIGGTIYQKNSKSNLPINLTRHSYRYHHAKRNHIFRAGTITSVNSSSITINSVRYGSLSFSINSNTKFKSQNQTPINVSDLKTGQSVLIRPKSPSSNQALLIILKN